MMKQIKKNKVIKIAAIILLFLSINLNAQSVDLELVNELVDNIKQGDLKSMKKLEAHLFGIILEIVESYDNNYKENTFLKTIEYVNKKINLNFNATNENGDTFLIAASRQGSLKIVKSLIGYGADVNAKNNDGRTALMLTSNLEIAKLLIYSGADVNAKNNNGGTALTRAVYWDKLEVAKLLIDNGADVNAKDDEFGQTALTQAVNWDRLEIAKLLIDNGADTKNSLTYLTSVTKWEMVKLLIDNGADINARGSGMFGTPPLIIRVINYMYNGPLPYDEYSEILEKIKFLIDKGADVNVKDNGGGYSVLEKTIDILNIQHWELVLEIVKLLVDNGANINAKDKNGNTALTYAKRKGNKGKEIVKFLMSRGAK